MVVDYWLLAVCYPLIANSVLLPESGLAGLRTAMHKLNED